MEFEIVWSDFKIIDVFKNSEQKLRSSSSSDTLIITCVITLALEVFYCVIIEQFF